MKLDVMLIISLLAFTVLVLSVGAVISQGNFIGAVVLIALTFFYYWVFINPKLKKLKEEEQDALSH